MSDRLYLDTSAYLAVVLDERDGRWVQQVTVDFRLCSSTLLVLEAQRAFLRLAREGHITADDFAKLNQRLSNDVDGIEFRTLTLDVCLSQEFPPVSIPRSLDLVHLRSALWFAQHGGLRAFVSLDADQRRAAGEFKLAIAAPP